MVRWLLLVLLSVLPLQMVWAAAAPYCAHEADTATKSQHFGHHAHAHVAGTENQPPADGDEASARSHPDCSSCHLGCAVTMPVAHIVTAAPPSEVATGDHRACFESHVPSGPERPDRSNFTAAARSGGDASFESLNA